jgi:hypothetical protein
MSMRMYINSKVTLVQKRDAKSVPRLRKKDRAPHQTHVERIFGETPAKGRIFVVDFQSRVRENC